MKKAVAFLLAFLIFVTPVTTFVKADVVIGDNDDTIMNENASILGRKLAMLESLSDLALSGVTEFTITNTEDVDSYLDSLWTEINDAIDYLDSGEWVEDIPSNIASKYYTNLVKYRDIVNNRGEFLGFDLQNPATSLLKTYFANDTYGRKYTSKDLYQSLDMFRALSGISRGTPTPQPDPDFSFIQNINSLYLLQDNSTDNSLMSYSGEYYNRDYSYYFTKEYNFNQLTIMSDDFVTNKNHLVDVTGGFRSYTYSPMTINVTTISENNIQVNYGDITSYFICKDRYNNGIGSLQWYRFSNNILQGGNTSYINNHSTPVFNQTSFDGLSSCLNYLYKHYCNINLYVDGVPWALIEGSEILSPTLDIDGLLKIFGNDQPQQYQLQPNTKIDYDQLYQVIYNAIRDNLPISQGDINYYDSHDTIYSPTIINNYGDEEGEESDLIDTILDYAVIPKFDTAIAQPMRQALTNGVVIMNNSITNVIPNEILLILGACFFLLLFAVVINRMIK